MTPRRAGLIAMLLFASTAHADDFGGWRFKAPAGERSESGDHVTFTKITGKTFCQIALFSAHAPSADDVAFEWKYVVEANFKVTSASKPVTTTSKQGLQLVTTTASVADQGGNAYAAVHHVVLGPGTAGSVLLTSSNKATLARCPIGEFVDSLSLAPKDAPAATAQPSESITGAWATGAGNPASRQGTGSTSRRQYTFKADGTYTYFSELYNGVNEWIHVRESGTYAIAGDRLTIAPASSSISSRDWNRVKSTKKLALEKVTYTFKKHYFSGIQEWNLVLTPPAATNRDGPFAANDQFKGSYLLSDSYKPEWKWP